MPELFTLGTWAGLPVWRCAFCPWDTTDGEAAVLAHIAARHMSQPEPEEAKDARPARRVLVADRRGRIKE